MIYYHRGNTKAVFVHGECTWKCVRSTKNKDGMRMMIEIIIVKAPSTKLIDQDKLINKSHLVLILIQYYVIYKSPWFIYVFYMYVIRESDTGKDENWWQSRREIMKQEGHPWVKLGYFTILMPYKHCALCIFKCHMIDTVDGDLSARNCWASFTNAN